jgi:hypothetical protein
MNPKIPYQMKTDQILPDMLQGYVSVNSKGKKYLTLTSMLFMQETE